MMNQQFLPDSGAQLSTALITSPRATPWLYAPRPLTTMALTAVLPSLSGTSSFIDRVRALQGRRTSQRQTVLELSSDGEYLVRPREACFLLGIGCEYEVLKLMCEEVGVSRVRIGRRVYYPLSGLAVLFNDIYFDGRG